MPSGATLQARPTRNSNDEMTERLDNPELLMRKKARRVTVETVEDTPPPADTLSEDEVSAGLRSRAETIYAQYLAEKANTVSTAGSIERLVAIVQLGRADVVDYGSELSNPRPRVALKPRLRTWVERATRELQDYLYQLAQEVPSRKGRPDSCFKIDPTQDLLTSLSNASNVKELSALWAILRVRLDRGRKFLAKYLKESKREAVNSPASTAAEVYGRFEDGARPETRIKEYSAYVQSHRKIDADEDLSTFMMRPITDLYPVDPELVRAFPPREPEENPVPLSYDDQTGQLVELEYLRRTSFSGPGFVPPQEDFAEGERSVYYHAQELPGPDAPPETSDSSSSTTLRRPETASAANDSASRRPVVAPMRAPRPEVAFDMFGRQKPYGVNDNFLYGFASSVSRGIRVPEDRPTRDLPPHLSASAPAQFVAPPRPDSGLSYVDVNTAPRAGATSLSAPVLPIRNLSSAAPVVDANRDRDRSSLSPGLTRTGRSPPEPSGGGPTSGPPGGGRGPPQWPPGPPGGGPPVGPPGGGGGGGGGGGPPLGPPGGGGPPQGPPGGGGGPPQGPPGGGGGPPQGPPGGGGGGAPPPPPPGGGPPFRAAAGAGGAPPPPPPGGGPPFPFAQPGGQPHNPYAHGWDAYFNMPQLLVPRMKSELRADDIPEWDGNKDTAITWFANVQESASNGGYIPWQIGNHLWHRLKEGTAIRSWYTTLPSNWKDWMKDHYLNFLTAVRDHYLGDRWQLDRTQEYALQRFRQDGHSRESPIEFVQRRLLYARMLMHVPIGGPEEVQEIMTNAPVSWKNILHLETVPSVIELQVRISNLENQLLDAARVQSQDVITRANLGRMLREAGYDLRRRQDGNAGAQSRPTRDGYKPRYATANAVQADGTAHDDDGNGAGESDVDHDDSVAPHDNLDAPVVEAYALAAKKQRPPPKGGYPFPKRDDKKSELRPPPSPCKCCGSALHWDKECPHWNLWLAKFGKGKSAYKLEAEVDATYECMYNSAFDALNMQAALGLYLDEGIKKEAFVSTATLVRLGLAQEPEKDTDLRAPDSPAKLARRTVTIEDEPEAPYVNPRPAATYIIESMTEENECYVSTTNATVNLDALVPTAPTPDERAKWLTPRRRSAPGESAVGVSVVSTRGWLGSEREEEVDLRFDSCADISLISEGFYRSLKKPPLLQKGLRLQLWQLTDKNAQLSGFVHIPVYQAWV